MSLLSLDEVSNEAYANHPSDPVDLKRQAITLLLSLGIVVLCGWVNGRF